MPKSLLIVDDEESICDLLKAFFEREGFKVHASYSGHQAIEVLNNHDIDLVISDLRMNDGDGMKLLRHTHDSKKNPMFIFMTGQYHFGGEHLEEMGVKKVFMKPLNFSDFVSNVSNILSD